ncbi:hypothetical protein Acr_00g0053520 [Actinidia rufa]|uniref:RNA-binding KH domain-containing protein n=1 Tax=Actinidia rufa TaxID=165716 RepID=A0A7J0DMV5_9ERIC|nr:hypothetical protein Acr_00g0053520 [Actinidia rufa]
MEDSFRSPRAKRSTAANSGGSFKRSKPPPPLTVAAGHVLFRLLCPLRSAGGVIGKSGAIVKQQLQQDPRRGVATGLRRAHHRHHRLELYQREDRTQGLEARRRRDGRASINRRTRGPTRGIEAQRVIDKKGTLPIVIAPQFHAPVGEHATRIASKIGMEDKMEHLEVEQNSQDGAIPMTQEELSIKVFRPRSSYVMGLGMRHSSFSRSIVGLGDNITYVT